MKYVNSPSLRRKKLKKKAQGANMGRVSEQIRAECGKRGDWNGEL